MREHGHANLHPHGLQLRNRVQVDRLPGVRSLVLVDEGRFAVRGQLDRAETVDLETGATHLEELGTAGARKPVQDGRDVVDVNGAGRVALAEIRGLLRRARAGKGMVTERAVPAVPEHDAESSRLVELPDEAVDEIVRAGELTSV